MLVDHQRSGIAGGVHFMIEYVADDFLSHTACALVDVVALHIRRQEIYLRDHLCARTNRVGSEYFVFPGDGVRLHSIAIFQLCFRNSPDQGRKVRTSSGGSGLLGSYRIRL